MKIKDFLENFNGANHIEIYDKHDFSTHRFNDVHNAIQTYGYFSVRYWAIDNNKLKITIQSQF